MPEPPQKPSFCSGDTTTQYIFDGCKVQVTASIVYYKYTLKKLFQNNKIYVGNQLARDLTDDEIDQLKKFDQQMTAYQSQINASLQKVRFLVFQHKFSNLMFQQVQEIFGEDFGRLFSKSGTTSDNQNGDNNEVNSGVATTSTTPLQAPEAPNFCTVVY